jgi:hypothetical protein
VSEPVHLPSMLRRSLAGSQDERQAEGGSCVVSPGHGDGGEESEIHRFDTAGSRPTTPAPRRSADRRLFRWLDGPEPTPEPGQRISIPAIRRRRFDVSLVMALIHEPAAPRCAECQDAILDRDLVLRLHGDWYHVRCVRTRRPDDASNRPPVVLCDICGTGIARVADVVMTDSGPKHRWCRPVVEAKRDRGRLRLVTGGLDATDG